MRKNAKEKRTCKKYGSKDAAGFVHCKECPLRKGKGLYDFRCKANSSYNRKNKEWEYDNISDSMSR